MVTRRELHELLDEIPEEGLGEAHRYLAVRRSANGDHVLARMLLAPEDDEEESEDEGTAVAEAYEDIRAGRLVSHDEVRRRLLSG